MYDCCCPSASRIVTIAVNRRFIHRHGHCWRCIWVRDTVCPSVCIYVCVFMCVCFHECVFPATCVSKCVYMRVPVFWKPKRMISVTVTHPKGY